MCLSGHPVSNQVIVAIFFYSGRELWCLESQLQQGRNTMEGEERKDVYLLAKKNIVRVNLKTNIFFRTFCCGFMSL